MLMAILTMLVAAVLGAGAARLASPARRVRRRLVRASDRSPKVARSGRLARSIQGLVRSSRREEQLALLLDRIGWGLRSGASLPQAFASAADGLPDPLGAELRWTVTALGSGRPFEEALTLWSPPGADTPRALVVAALTVAARSGGASADALDGVAATIRDRQAVERETRALTTQARASAAVIVLAPIAFGLALAAGDQQVLRFLTSDPVGVTCLAAGLALDVVGGLWMGRIAGGAEA